MAEDDVLGQADALMRRHRSFVARSAEDLPVATPGETTTPDRAAMPDDAGIPLLTDIVDTQAIAPRDLEAVLAALRDEIDAAVSSWLAEALPAAVAGASQQLLAELDARARGVLLPRLREIVAQRRGEAARDPSL